MTYKEITEAIAALTDASYRLEELYIESEGEVTEESEELDAAADDIRRLLLSEGVDSLGEWLKGLEDRKRELRAQKDFVCRKIAALDKSVEFVKATISAVLEATGTEKVRGSLGYSFARTESSRTTLREEALDDEYLDMVTEAVRAAGLPGYVDVALKTNATRVKEWADSHDGEGAGFVETTTAPSVRFTKPRANTK